MKNIYLNDKKYTFLINRLIKDNKIKITLDKSVRYFENLIEIKISKTGENSREIEIIGGDFNESFSG